MSASKYSPITSSLIFFVLGIAFAAVLGGDLLSGAASQSFVPAPGVITASTLKSEEFMDSDGMTHTNLAANVSYSYDVNGRSLVGSAVYLGDPSPSASMLVNPNELLATYAVGTKHTVYYDPAKPEVACLRRGFGPAGYGVMVFLAFLWSCGAFVLLWGFANKPGLLRKG